MPSTTLGMLVAVLAAAVVSEGVLASLYPTRPVSDTIYCAGRKERVTWIDDGREPHLDQLGPVDMELHTSDGDYVSTLSTQAEPHSRSCTVDIPLDLPSGSHNYTLYFIPMKPHAIIYTADFPIIKEDLPTPVLAHIQTAPPTSDNIAHRLLTLVLPNTTITSQIAAEPTGNEAPGVTLYAEPLTKTGPTRGNKPKAPIANGAIPSARTSLERVQFLFVFILWPALVGISMAL